MTQQGSADIGVTGLAVMGRNLARNLARHGYVVALHNRSPERTRSLVKEHGDEGTLVPAESMEEFVASLSRPRAIIIMVKAGEATDAVIDELVPLLDQGDIVIDCGNAHFMDTRRREAALRDRGLHFVGMRRLRRRGRGAPRAEHHARRVRGVLRQDRPDVRVDRRERGRHSCCTHVGPDGAGHFVKMVHNGIEYARHAAHRRGLRPAAGGSGASPAEIATSSAPGTRGTWTRS